MRELKASEGKSSKKPVKYVFKLLNPLRIFRALNFHRAQKKYSKSSHDHELRLFSEMLSNDMLHFGYFEDINIEPERISPYDIESAQIRYAEILIGHILDKSLPVLDIGCGIGGIANLILKHGFTVELISPNAGQLDYIKKKYPSFVTFNTRFEEFHSDKKYGTLLNAESFQYIDMPAAFTKANSIISPGGRWIISDYFPIKICEERQSHTRFEKFEQLAREHGWQVVYKEDITYHVLPTLKFANMYIARVVNPIIFYLEKKLLVKMAWLHHLTREIREKLLSKLAKEFSKVDPDIFLAEKRYIIIVMEKSND